MIALGVFSETSFSRNALGLAVVVSLAVTFGGLSVALVDVVSPGRTATAMAIVLAGIVSGARWGGSFYLNTALLAACVLLAFTSVRLTESVAVSDIGFLLAAILLVTIYGINGILKSSLSKSYFIGTVLLVLGASIGGALSDSPQESMLPTVRLLIVVVGLPFIISAAIRTQRMLIVTSWAFVGSITISSVVALTVADEFNRSRKSGLAGHPNALALLCVMGLGFCMVVMIYSKGAVRFLALACGVISLFGVFTSGSRAGFVGAFACLALLVLVAASFKLILKLAGISIGIVILATTGLVPIPGVTFTRLAGDSSATASDATRIDYLLNSIDIWLSSPLWGVGLSVGGLAHNLYVQTLAAGGIIMFSGLCMILISLWRATRLVVAGQLRHAPDTLAIITLGWSIGYGGFLAAEVFQNALWERYMWLPPALILAAARLRSQSPTQVVESLGNNT